MGPDSANHRINSIDDHIGTIKDYKVTTVLRVGWMLSTPSPVHSLAISSLLGIIPIYTFMAATYDGSLAALLLASIVLFLSWILPMGLGKSERKAQ